MNTKTEEALARYVAGVLGDAFPYDPAGAVHVEVTTPEMVFHARGTTYLSPAEYLSCKNVAGRFLEWAQRQYRENSTNYKHFGFMLHSHMRKFRDSVFDDTPTAMLELAKATGFVEPEEN